MGASIELFGESGYKQSEAGELGTGIYYFNLSKHNDGEEILGD